MSTLTIREYIPKVPNTITHKLPPKPCWTIPGKESTKPSAKAAEDNEWRKKPAPVSELMSQENALFNTEKAHGQITRRENSEDDDSDLLKRHRARFNRKSPEEGSQESRAGSSSDEPIELDSKLDLDEDLETTHVHCAQGGGQPNNDALDIETLLALPNGPADEPYNSISTVDTNPSSSSAKQVRLASPCQIPDLGLSTPPYSCDGDRKRSMTDSESSGSGESQDSTFSPKRRKPSPQGVETALNGHYGQLERSPSVISGDAVGNHSVDSHPSTASLSTPAASDSALEASRICPQFVDINQEWEYREIIGEEIVDGVPCYEMEWCSSLIPKTWVQNNELVAEYEARKERAHAYQRVKKGRKGRPDLKQGCRAVEAAGSSAGQQVKRPRGRSRK